MKTPQDKKTHEKALAALRAMKELLKAHKTYSMSSSVFNSNDTKLIEQSLKTLEGVAKRAENEAKRIKSKESEDK